MRLHLHTKRPSSRAQIRNVVASSSAEMAPAAFTCSATSCERGRALSPASEPWAPRLSPTPSGPGTPPACPALSQGLGPSFQWPQRGSQPSQLPRPPTTSRAGSCALALAAWPCDPRVPHPALRGSSSSCLRGRGSYTGFYSFGRSHFEGDRKPPEATPTFPPRPAPRRTMWTSMDSGVW